MPELSEVEITRLKIEPLVKGRRILYFWTDWPRGLKAANGKGQRANGARVARDIRGRKIEDVSRRGKVLFFHLSGNPERLFAIHLRMSGRLAVLDRNDNHDYDSGDGRSSSLSSSSSPKWTHFKWFLSGKKDLCFIDPRKFGVVWFGSRAGLDKDPYLSSLGKDARNISFQEFRSVFGKGGNGMIKAFLLRQDRLSGIGNIIADEMLWRARVHPESKIGDLDSARAKKLHRALSDTLLAMFDAGGTSLRDWGHPDGSRGSYQERRLIYGRAGKKCPRCRALLERIRVAGRGTTICPKCQKMRKYLNPKSQSLKF